MSCGTDRPGMIFASAKQSVKRRNDLSPFKHNQHPTATITTPRNHQHLTDGRRSETLSLLVSVVQFRLLPVE